MEKKREICEYREKLDKTLASPELTNEKTLRTLVRNQLSEECNVDELDQRVTGLSSLLENLKYSTKDQDLRKSSNKSSYGDWKVEYDREDCRVMYCERPEKRPFRTVFMDGYIDGTIEECLCVSWESSLYEKWWPKSSFPSYGIIQSKCLQKFRINEQICFVRGKVPWPFANREATVQFFLFEYFTDGLVIVLLNSISSEGQSIGKSGLLEAVGIDLVGGFAIQKVSPKRCYLRLIGDGDVKLDLLPTALISRLSGRIGNYFRRYKETIGSVATSVDYSRVLVDPLYTNIRKAMYSNDKTDEICNAKELQSKEGRDNELIETRHCENEHVTSKGDVHEIEVEEECVDEKEEGKTFPPLENRNVDEKTQNNNGVTLFCILHKVKQALETLERVISVVKKSRTYNHTSSSSEEEEEEASSSPLSQKQHSESTTIVSNNNVCIQDPKTEVLDEVSIARNHTNNMNRQSGSSSFAKESNKTAHASPKIDLATDSDDVARITISEDTTLFNQIAENNDDKPNDLDGVKTSILHTKPKKRSFGCMSWMRRT